MSYAPQTLVDLRQFLAEQFEVLPNRFGIRGVVSPRRPWGYHLGKADIYGPDGMGDRDYSVRRPRDIRGLTNASAGFDINVGAAKERQLVKYLVDLAKSGNDARMLVEVIGPDLEGVARRWVKPHWDRPLTARADHDWHIHLSFLRDTEFVDKRPLFLAFFGLPPDYLEPVEPDEPDHPEEPEAPPDLCPEDA